MRLLANGIVALIQNVKASKHPGSPWGAVTRDLDELFAPGAKPGKDAGLAAVAERHRVRAPCRQGSDVAGRGQDRPAGLAPRSRATVAWRAGAAQCDFRSARSTARDRPTASGRVQSTASHGLVAAASGPHLSRTAQMSCRFISEVTLEPHRIVGEEGINAKRSQMLGQAVLAMDVDCVDEQRNRPLREFGDHVGP